ncbi:hypothetical protein QQG74_10550 [Micromonospora sp. FIMYZ51]|uniref:hypothetical protein n=1 Tax=Micromonospora sp. FIMYZ51 TaxID=3051832 RepID=UPI00311F429C
MTRHRYHPVTPSPSSMWLAPVRRAQLYIRRTGLGGAMIWSLDGDDDNATLTRTISLGLSTR